MNLPLDAVAKLVWTQIWQVTVVVIAVGVLTKICCRTRPHLAYALWLLVLAKCLTPPLLSSPTSVFSWLTRANPAAVNAGATIPAPQVIVHAASEKRPSALPNRVSETSSASPASTNPIVTPSKSSRISATTIIAMLWLIGAMACASVAMAVTVRLRRIIHRESKSIDPRLHALFDDLKRLLNIRRSVRLAVIQESLGPLTFGWLRPIVVMPEALANDSIEERLKPLLAHELIHVRRGDAIVGLIQTAAQCLWWFHPLVWWANRQMVQQRERCCDEETIARLQIAPGRYARSLLDVVEIKQRMRWPAALPGIRPLEVTKQRLEHIMLNHLRVRSRTPRAIWVAVFAGVLLLIPGAGLTRSTSLDAAAEPVQKPTNQSDNAKPDTIVISGKCVDEEHKPIALARVRLFLIDRSAQNTSLVELQDVRTNADGQYQLIGVNSLLLNEGHPGLIVVAQSPGRAYASSAGIGREKGPQATIDLTLPIAFALQGRVIDVDGKPVIGAVVAADCPSLMSLIPGVCSAVTDENGQYCISDLLPWNTANQKPQPLGNGRWGIVIGESGNVRHPDFAREIFKYSKVPDTINITMHRSAIVNGNVTLGETGQPAAGVQIEFWNDVVSADYWTRAVTDKDGNYQVRSLPPGNYHMSVALKGRPNIFLEDIALREGENQLKTPMTKGSTVRGRVIDANTRKPIAMGEREMSISTHNSKGEAFAGMNHADVQPDGTFELRLPPGRAYLGYYIAPKWDQFRIEFVPDAAFSDKGISIGENETIDVEIRMKSLDKN